MSRSKLKSDLNLVNFEQNLGFATIDKRWENQDDIRENVFNEAQKAYSTTLELQDSFHKPTPSSTTHAEVGF